MRQRVFNLASAISLILLVGAVSMLIRERIVRRESYHELWSRGGWEYSVGIESGWFKLARSQELRVPPEATTYQWLMSRPRVERKFMGLEFFRGEDAYADLFSIGRPTFVHDYGRYEGIGISGWLAVPFLTLLPVAAIQCLTRQLLLRRNNPFGCPKCGYDLRASSDRCPECGTVPRGMGVPPM